MHAEAMTREGRREEALDIIDAAERDAASTEAAFSLPRTCLQRGRALLALGRSDGGRRRSSPRASLAAREHRSPTKRRSSARASRVGDERVSSRGGCRDGGGRALLEWLGCLAPDRAGTSRGSRHPTSGASGVPVDVDQVVDLTTSGCPSPLCADRGDDAGVLGAGEVRLVVRPRPGARRVAEELPRQPRTSGPGTSRAGAGRPARRPAPRSRSSVGKGGRPGGRRELPLRSQRNWALVWLSSGLRNCADCGRVRQRVGHRRGTARCRRRCRGGRP